MQEYKITGDQLYKLNKLTSEGYEVFEVNTYMGYAEIILSNDDWHQQVITIEATN